MRVEGLMIMAWCLLAVLSTLMFVTFLFQCVSWLQSGKISRLTMFKYLGLGAVGLTAFIFITRWLLLSLFDNLFSML